MLWIAAFIVALTGIVHSWLGERMLIGPMLAPENRSGPLLQRRFNRSLLRFAWHITTVTWFGVSAVLLILGAEPLNAPGRYAVLAIAATFLIMGLISLVVGRGRHPSWAAFLATAALCMAATYA